MVTNTAPEKAKPGQQGAKDWLTLKIIECLVQPMDDTVAQKLAVYSAAQDALCKADSGKEPSTRSKSLAQSRNGEDRLTPQIAKEWANEMENEDGSQGPHWTLEDTKKIQAGRNIEADPYAFWVALNATYSDLCMFFKRYGISRVDAYVDYVKTFWLEDKDAVSDKLLEYYKHVVQH